MQIKKKFFFPVLFLYLILNSCSRFAVFIIENRIVSRADENFNLTAEQEAWVKERVSAHIQTLRSRFIPSFVQVIDNGLQVYADGLTEAETFSVIDSLRDSFRPYIKNMMVDFGVFYGKLEANQWERYQVKKIERDTERREKEAKRKAENEDPMDMIYERYEEIYGSLNAGQKQLLNKLHTENPESFTEERRINFDSTLFAQSLSEIIKADLKSEDKIKAMQDLFRDPDKVLDAVNYDGIFQKIKENQRKLVVIDAAMSPKQREHFVEKWQDIRDQLKSFIP